MLLVFATGLPILAVITVAAIFHRWRCGVYGVFVWLFVGDMIRRLIPGQPPAVMLIGDILLVITFCSFFFRIMIRGKGLWMPPFVITLLLFVAIVVINILNPNSPGILFGIIGLRSYLWYVPLLFLGYYMFTTEDQLLRFCRVLVYAAIPLLVFAVIQYMFHDSAIALLRPFEAGHQDRSFSLVEAAVVRKISSVFGDAQRYAMVSMFLFFLGMAVYLRSPNSKLLLRAAIMCSFLGVIISASRAAFILSLMGFIAFYLLALRPGSFHLGTRTVKTVLLVVLMLPVLLFAIFRYGGDVGLLQVSAFYFAIVERIPWMFGDIGGVFTEVSYWGHGTGAMSQGLHYISGGEEWYAKQLALRRGGFESGISKLVFELGIPGLMLFYLLWGSVLYKIANELKKINSFYFKNIAIAVGIFLSLVLVRFSFIHHQVLGDAAILTIIWFFTGVVFGLKRLRTSRMLVVVTDRK
jgi:hypothetical protein